MIPPSVTFYPWGLLTSTNSTQQEEQQFSGIYGKLEHGTFLSLDAIMRRLGHEQSRISIIKMDCEGCALRLGPCTGACARRASMCV
jgi:hypothetical protein